MCFHNLGRCSLLKVGIICKGRSRPKLREQMRRDGRVDRSCYRTTEYTFDLPCKIRASEYFKCFFWPPSPRRAPESKNRAFVAPARGIKVLLLCLQEDEVKMWLATRGENEKSYFNCRLSGRPGLPAILLLPLLLFTTLWIIAPYFPSLIVFIKSFHLCVSSLTTCSVSSSSLHPSLSLPLPSPSLSVTALQLLPANTLILAMI